MKENEQNHYIREKAMYIFLIIIWILILIGFINWMFS